MPHTFRKFRPFILAALAASTAVLAGSAHADDQPLEGVKLDIDAIGGVHFFAQDLELGVADDPTLPSPQSPSGEFGLRLGLQLHPMFALEGEGLLIPTADNKATNWRAYVATYRAHALLNIAPGKIADGKVTPFVLAGLGGLSVVSTQGTEYNEIKKDTDFIFYFGAGVKIALTPRVHLRFDARLDEVPNTKPKGVSPDFELLGAIGFTLGGHPASAPPPPPPPPPPMVKDSDGDGIPDTTDKCPMEAGPPENGGCPDKDRDKDGVVDRKDKCPDEAGPADRDGCPIHDRDGDGIADEVDKCPDEAEDKDGFEDEDGCPDLDNDKDGVPDAQDKCPTEMETKNGYKDDDGCPDEVPPTVKKFTGVVKGINFRRNSADIKASSFPLLKEAVKVFKDYPDVRIEISGHTSIDGKRDYNMRLSYSRAASVKLFLVSAGIEENRISTVGFGPDKPIEDNSTKDGQEKNRRIEFRLLSPDEKIESTPPPAAPEMEKPAKSGNGTKKARKAKGEPVAKPAGETGGPDQKAVSEQPAGDKPVVTPAASKKKKKKASAAPEGDPMP